MTEPPRLGDVTGRTKEQEKIRQQQTSSCLGAIVVCVLLVCVTALVITWVVWG